MNGDRKERKRIVKKDERETGTARESERKRRERNKKSTMNDIWMRYTYR
jgi:hypothetical protein